MYPPVIAVRCSVIGVAFGLNTIQNVVIDLRELLFGLNHGKAEKVDDKHTTRSVGQVFPISIVANMLFQPGHSAQPHGMCILRRNYEATTEQTYSQVAQALIRKETYGSHYVRTGG